MVVGPSLIVSTSVPDAFSTATDIAVSIKEEGLTVEPLAEKIKQAIAYNNANLKCWVFLFCLTDFYVD